MSWAVGWDFEHRRWRGYGVPAYCDAKDCHEEIDRGLAYVCEGFGCPCEGEDDVDKSLAAGVLLQRFGGVA